MILLDSNIIIYSSYPENQFLREIIAYNDVAVSKITLLETLGYHKISESEKNYLSHLFNNIKQIPINDAVIDKAIELRQMKKISTGDAIIAATTILLSCRLATRNIDDFKGLNLDIYDPFTNDE